MDKGASRVAGPHQRRQTLTSSSTSLPVGNPSLLIDVILNTEVHTKLKKDAEYKLYIIQVVRTPTARSA